VTDLIIRTLTSSHAPRNCPGAPAPVQCRDVLADDHVAQARGFEVLEGVAEQGEKSWRPRRKARPGKTGKKVDAVLDQQFEPARREERSSAEYDCLCARDAVTSHINGWQRAVRDIHFAHVVRIVFFLTVLRRSPGSPVETAPKAGSRNPGSNSIQRL